MKLPNGDRERSFARYGVEPVVIHHAGVHYDELLIIRRA